MVPEAAATMMTVAKPVIMAVAGRPARVAGPAEDTNGSVGAVACVCASCAETAPAVAMAATNAKLLVIFIEKSPEDEVLLSVRYAILKTVTELRVIAKRSEKQIFALGHGVRRP